MLVAQGLELHIIWHQKSCEDMVMVPRSGSEIVSKGGYKLMFEKHVGLNWIKQVSFFPEVCGFFKLLCLYMSCLFHAILCHFRCSSRESLAIISTEDQAATDAHREQVRKKRGTKNDSRC